MRILLLGLSPVTIHLGEKFCEIGAKVTFLTHEQEKISSLIESPLLKDYVTFFSRYLDLKSKTEWIDRKSVISLQKSKISLAWSEKRFLDDFALYWKNEGESVIKTSFDLVIDGEWFFDSSSQQKINGNDFVLGEDSLNFKIKNQFDFLVSHEELEAKWKDHASNLLVSSYKNDWSSLIHQYLLENNNFRKNLAWISSNDYESEKENDWEQQFLQQDYQARKKIYHQLVEDYEKLEDYEKVKVKKPVMGEDRLKVLNHHNITSVNQFEDASDVIVNIEDLTNDKFVCLNVCDLLNFQPFRHQLIHSGHLKKPLMIEDIKNLEKLNHGNYEKGLISFGHNEGIFIKYWSNLNYANRVFDLVLSYFSKRD